MDMQWQPALPEDDSTPSPMAEPLPPPTPLDSAPASPPVKAARIRRIVEPERSG